MERLTTRNIAGVAVYKNPFECDRCGDTIWRLPDYGNESPTEKLADYNVEQRLLKEKYWVQYYSQNGYNILNTEKLLSNKNSRQKRNKPNTKYIKVLTKNYNEAIQLLKDKGLLYET